MIVLKDNKLHMEGDVQDLEAELALIVMCMYMDYVKKAEIEPDEVEYRIKKAIVVGIDKAKEHLGE